MSDLRNYYDESYPPSVYAPPVVPPNPVSVNPGTPGTWAPPGSAVPANLNAIRALGALGQTAAWANGAYMVLGDASHAYWNATTWNVGNAPTPPPEEPEEP